MLKRVLVVVFILILGGCIYSTKINSSYAVGETESSTVNETVQEKDKDKGTSLIAAALAVGLAAIGSGIAVAVVASSAVGAISENPSLLGKTVIFAGLAEGIAIYGLIVSIMILSKV
jgi:V/A-type H+-transporting ATPase subunit K